MAAQNRKQCPRCLGESRVAFILRKSPILPDWRDRQYGCGRCRGRGWVSVRKRRQGRARRALQAWWDANAHQRLPFRNEPLTTQTVAYAGTHDPLTALSVDWAILGGEDT